MARKPGRPTASKTTAAKETAAPEKEETVTTTGTTFTLKTTISVKQRNETGDEIFVSTGIEVANVTEDELDARKASAAEIVDGWIKDRVESVGAAAFGGYSEDDAEEASEDGEDGEDEDGEDEDGEDLTEEAINAMKKPELDALIEEHGLDIDTKLKLADKRAAIIEALFAEDEDEDGDDDGDEEEEEDDEGDEGDEDGDEEPFEPYTEEELGEMKLKELDEIANEWELKVKHKAGADLKAKKANVIKAILKYQEENAEE